MSPRSHVLGAARGAGAVLLLARLAGPLAAHDHWIAPSSFHPAAGERVDLHLCVGHPAEFEEQVRDPLHIVRFDDIGPLGTRPIAGLDGRSPAGILRPRDEGLYLVVFRSKHAFVEIEAAKYAEYLAAEGLDDVQAERERRGEVALAGRDSYARFDKALVCVGEPARSTGPGVFAEPLGLPLELVLETDPFAFREGDEVVLQLELEGRALSNRQVKLMHIAAPHRILLARTDAEGRVRFRPPESGAWVASAVHQRRTTSEQELPGEWEGLWASFSFELSEP